ncbi:thiamine permease [Marispirochaeta aestuarii]|uniref:thiamine permease n=1 Tax=Marispirochaeta aestuarii TaxID=1963862 RepID=UPI0029C7F730|nr:thiamine permease [Marispirochaeta aestuarii]
MTTESTLHSEVQTSSPVSLSSLHLGILWFGAAVSLAEIITGSLYDSMSTGSAVLAILAGHLIGAVAFYAVGWISWKEDKDAIAIADSSLGKAGVRIFALINALQLVGWTAVMILAGSDGLKAAAAAMGLYINLPWARLITGLLLLVWTAAGFRGMRNLNIAAVTLLFFLSVLWAVKLFLLPGTAEQEANAAPAFGGMLELAVIMPLSWLPLVGDYTRNARHGRSGVSAAALGYFIGSCAMYLLGLLSIRKIPDAGPVASMLLTGLGPAAALVVLLSTVTTGFLDVHSAGVSLRLVFPRLGQRTTPLLMGVLGLVLALAAPGGWYEHFLYALGSVFAPFFGVIFCRRLFFSPTTPSITDIVIGFGAWAVGLAGYYVLLPLGFPLGVSVPALIISMISYYLLQKGANLWIQKH